jgi:hypothetical protein
MSPIELPHSKDEAIAITVDLDDKTSNEQNITFEPRTDSYLRPNGLLAREKRGCCLDENAVQTMKGWRKERELIRRVSRKVLL